MEKIAIEDIINEHGNYIVRLSYTLCGNADEAKDIAQETFIKAWQHMDQLKDKNALKKWLHKICVNEFYMMKRKSRGNIFYTDDIEGLEREGALLVDTPVQVIDEMQATKEVIDLRNGCFRAMAQKLTLNQRIVFSLIDMFGLCIDETAIILDITPKAVKGLLYRARMNVDAFFHNHCQFLNINHPCRCEAWITFFENRGKLQEAMKNNILNYKEKGYEYDEGVRRKVAYYYQHIPNQIPEDIWYQQVIDLIKNKKI